MDKAAEQNEIENKQAFIEAWVKHPVTQEVYRALAESEKTLVDILCSTEIVDIASFFKHFEAVGHLRGLRKTKSVIEDQMDELNQQKEAL